MLSGPTRVLVLEWPGATMRILDRYIFREVLSHTLLGLAVFTFVFFIPQLVRLMDLIVRHAGGAGRRLADEHKLPATTPKPTFTLGLDN